MSVDLYVVVQVSRMTIALDEYGTDPGGGETRMGEKGGIGADRSISVESGEMGGCSTGVVGAGGDAGAGRRGLGGWASRTGCGLKSMRTLVSLRASSGVRTTTAP